MRGRGVGYGFTNTIYKIMILLKKGHTKSLSILWSHSSTRVFSFQVDEQLSLQRLYTYPLCVVFLKASHESHQYDAWVDTDFTMDDCHQNSPLAEQDNSRHMRCSPQSEVNCSIRCAICKSRKVFLITFFFLTYQNRVEKTRRLMKHDVILTRHDIRAEVCPLERA